MSIAIEVINRAVEAGLSQRDVAKIVGVSPQAVTFWSKGRKPQSSEVIDRLLYLRARLGELTEEDKGRFRNLNARRTWVKQHMEEK